jgi:hypothetical protein
MRRLVAARQSREEVVPRAISRLEIHGAKKHQKYGGNPACVKTVLAM